MIRFLSALILTAIGYVAYLRHKPKAKKRNIRLRFNEIPYVIEGDNKSRKKNVGERYVYEYNCTTNSFNMVPA